MTEKLSFNPSKTITFGINSYIPSLANKTLKNPWRSHCGLAVRNPTSIHDNVGSIPGLAYCGEDPELLWLWYRLLAAALIRPIAWELPYARGCSPKKKKKKKKIQILEGIPLCPFLPPCSLPLLKLQWTSQTPHSSLKNIYCPNIFLSLYLLFLVSKHPCPLLNIPHSFI